MKLLAICFFFSQTTAIWPAPKLHTFGTSAVWIQHSFTVKYNDQELSTRGVETRSSNIDSQSVVEEAVQRARDIIWAENFVPWKLLPRNTLSDFEPDLRAKKTYINTLTITQTGKDNATTFKPLAGQVDESYNLKVGIDGTASITAVSSIGVLHALQTFTQLFYQHSQGGQGIYLNTAPVAVMDAPKFSHRGLNMDVARNWYPKSNILHAIDALSWNKMNRLHLHMTDSQSWPLDIPALPDLSKKGAYQTGLSYTPQDLEDIQVYGAYRGVEVYLEFDMPGHTTSIGYAYPDLIAAFDAKPWATYCNEPPCGSLKLNLPAVSIFLQELFADVIPRVTPYSAYLHTGGDEVKNSAYLLDETVKSDEFSVLQPLLQKFVDRNHDQIRKAGLVPVVWEEMALNWNLTLGKDVLVQTWLSSDSVKSITSLGNKVLFGNYDQWYLDCGTGDWMNYENSDVAAGYPFADWCPPYKNWREIYTYDPLAGLTAAEAALVIGGEVHLWSEQSDPSNWDNMVWPRASAAAEVMWSGRQDASGQDRSQLHAAPRLNEFRERMIQRGVTCAPIQMIFCSQANATECIHE